MDKIAIVILNWNGLHHLKTFLPSVVRWSKEATIYVADNNSTDNSIAYLQSDYKTEVKVIALSRNEGFSKGYNLALKTIKAEYYILLNSDVEVVQGWLFPLINYLDAHPEIGACQPKINSFNNKSLFEYAGAGGGFIDKFGFPFCRGRIFGTIEQDVGQYDDITEVFWASGACLFVRSEIYWAVGGLDNDFFAHMEEIDLCWRIQRLGYKVCYFGTSQVYHLGGGTLSASDPQKTYLNFRNGLYLLFKNLPSEKLIPILFVRLCLDGLAAFKFLFFDSFSHFLAVGKAHLGFYFFLPHLIRKRKQSSKLKITGDLATIYQGSIVSDYFLKKNKDFRALKGIKSKKNQFILHQDSININF